MGGHIAPGGTMNHVACVSNLLGLDKRRALIQSIGVSMEVERVQLHGSTPHVDCSRSSWFHAHYTCGGIVQGGCSAPMWECNFNGVYSSVHSPAERQVFSLLRVLSIRIAAHTLRPQLTLQRNTF